MYIVTDIETTGLPKKRKADYQDLDCFACSRIVSICWFLVDDHHNLLEVGNYLIKPDGFIVTPSSTAIHGISHDEATRNGMPLHQVLTMLIQRTARCHTIVSHNIEFDLTIIKSELFRSGFSLESFSKIKNYCTMLEGKKQMKLYKYPKLIELLKFMCPSTVMVNAHNAYFDTLYCWQCYKELTVRKGAVSCYSVP